MAGGRLTLLLLLYETRPSECPSLCCAHEIFIMKLGTCPYGYVGYGDLPAVTVSCFWTDRIEPRMGVFTPHFERQRRQIQLLPLPFSYIFFALSYIL